MNKNHEQNTFFWYIIDKVTTIVLTKSTGHAHLGVRQNIHGTHPFNMSFSQ